MHIIQLKIKQDEAAAHLSLRQKISKIVKLACGRQIHNWQYYGKAKRHAGKPIFKGWEFSIILCIALNIQGQTSLQ
jgi:hypothetical protein